MSAPATPAPPESWLELPDGRTFWLKDRCTIGRQAGNDLVLDLPALSRQHALISVSEGRYVLSDLHSRNGTYLNNTAITRPAPVGDGDELRFGDAKVRFRCKRRWFGFGATPAAPEGLPTQRLDSVEERLCWLLLLDVAGYTALTAQLGAEIAGRRLQAWIAGLRPLLEMHGGRIDSYVGDAIFAHWECAATPPAKFLAVLRALEAWRPQSPLPFRAVIHHGATLFTRSDRGEELTGPQVNFVYRGEKIAKGFDATTLLSSAVTETLDLLGACPCYGRSAVDGMTNFYSFYALPPGFGAEKSGG